MALIINHPIVGGLRSVRLTGLGDLGLSAVASTAPLAATLTTLDPAMTDLGQTLDSLTADDLSAPGRGPRGAGAWVRDVVRWRSLGLPGARGGLAARQLAADAGRPGRRRRLPRLRGRYPACRSPVSA